MEEVKVCKTCQEEKSLLEFYPEKRRKDGLSSSCKMCKKQYYIDNKEKITEDRKFYYRENVDKVKEYQKKYNSENKDKRKQYNQENSKKVNKRKRERMKIDPSYQMREVLRTRFKDLVKDGYIDYTGSKTKRSQELLGCSLKTFKVYIEKQFEEGMSFENHGIDTWHYDHIKPLSSFDLSKEQEQVKAFHYTNFQPLWAKDNLMKSNKMENEYWCARTHPSLTRIYSWKF